MNTENHPQAPGEEHCISQPDVETLERLSPLPTERSITVAYETIRLLDEVIPDLFCTVEAAIAYLNDEQGSGPLMIALALQRQRERLTTILLEAGLLDIANSSVVDDI